MIIYYDTEMQVLAIADETVPGGFRAILTSEGETIQPVFPGEEDEGWSLKDTSVLGIGQSLWNWGKSVFDDDNDDSTMHPYVLVSQLPPELQQAIWATDPGAESVIVEKTGGLFRQAAASDGRSVYDLGGGWYEILEETSASRATRKEDPTQPPDFAPIIVSTSDATQMLGKPMEQFFPTTAQPWVWTDTETGRRFAIFPGGREQELSPPDQTGVSYFDDPQTGQRFVVGPNGQIQNITLKPAELQTLEQQMAQAVAKGDLDEANRIADVVRSLGERLNPLAIEERHQKIRLAEQENVRSQRASDIALAQSPGDLFTYLTQLRGNEPTGGFTPSWQGGRAISGYAGGLQPGPLGGQPSGQQPSAFGGQPSAGLGTPGPLGTPGTLGARPAEAPTTVPPITAYNTGRSKELLEAEAAGTIQPHEQNELDTLLAAQFGRSVAGPLGRPALPSEEQIVTNTATGQRGPTGVTTRFGSSAEFLAELARRGGIQALSNPDVQAWIAAGAQAAPTASPNIRAALQSSPDITSPVSEGSGAQSARLEIIQRQQQIDALMNDPRIAALNGPSRAAVDAKLAESKRRIAELQTQIAPMIGQAGPIGTTQQRPSQLGPFNANPSIGAGLEAAFAGRAVPESRPAEALAGLSIPSPQGWRNLVPTERAIFKSEFARQGFQMPDVKERFSRTFGAYRGSRPGPFTTAAGRRRR